MSDPELLSVKDKLRVLDLQNTAESESQLRTPAKVKGMKILQIVTRSELRGAEVFAGQLSDALAARGHELWLAALYRNTGGPAQLLANPQRQIELNGKVKGRIEPLTLLRLARLMRQIRPDVVQANAFHALKYAVLAKHIIRKPFKLVYRNVSMASDWTRGQCRRAWGRWLMRSVDAVTSVSDISARDFCQLYKYPVARTWTILRGVHVPVSVDRDKARQRVSEIVGLELPGPLLFHIGGFTAEKNHAGLLAAYERVCDRHPNAHLILCGDGPLRESMIQLAKERSLSSVHFLGATTDARELLTAADLLLLSSHTEGIPGVVLEAAAVGIPSVCTDVGAIRDLLEDGVTGRVVPPGNSDAFANAVSELLDDVPRRKRFGNEARKHVLGVHGMSHCAESFDLLYRLSMDTGSTLETISNLEGRIC